MPAGGTLAVRVTATPAVVSGGAAVCLIAVVSIPAAHPSPIPAGAGSEVCGFKGKEPPPPFPLQITLRGPSRVRVGQLNEYEVVVRNGLRAPLQGISITVGQSRYNPAPRLIPVASDWGLKHGREMRESILLRSVGRKPISFHLWWRAERPHTLRGPTPGFAQFGIAAYSHHSYPNPPTIVYATLVSPIAAH